VPQSMARSLSPGQFLEAYLSPGHPVVVRGALSSWAAVPPWDLAALADRFGDAQVPAYDTLFSLQRVVRFADYIADHTGPSATGTPPYLRWFTRHSKDRLPWADDAFRALAGEWAVPSWLPDAGYIFPRTRGRADAAHDAFPARGLFICGRGGRTRLHVDPWVSDACQCQVTGTKRFIMFPPSAGRVLAGRSGVVDLDRPDARRFPRWADAAAAVDEVLFPGDAIFIPAGWYHTAVALSDSVSITWNFVHQVHEERFTAYLRAGGAADPVVSYFRSAGLTSGAATR
jgi:hypothetical protein